MRLAAEQCLVAFGLPLRCPHPERRHHLLEFGTVNVAVPATVAMNGSEDECHQGTTTVYKRQEMAKCRASMAMSIEKGERGEGVEKGIKGGFLLAPRERRTLSRTCETRVQNAHREWQGA